MPLWRNETQLKLKLNRPAFSIIILSLNVTLTLTCSWDIHLHMDQCCWVDWSLLGAKGYLWCARTGEFVPPATAGSIHHAKPHFCLCTSGDRVKEPCPPTVVPNPAKGGGYNHWIRGAAKLLFSVHWRQSPSHLYGSKTFYSEFWPLEGNSKFRKIMALTCFLVLTQDTSTHYKRKASCHSPLYTV